MPNIKALQLVFLLLPMFIIALGQLAPLLGTPYPIGMIIGGMSIELVPWIPRIALDPDLIFPRVCY